MKHNLGKPIGRLIGVYLFLALTLLVAADFSHTFNLSKPNPYVKEPVILTLDLNQTNHDIVLLFNFDLKKSDAYFFQRLDVKESDAHHDTKVHYTYLIYPLRSGEIEIDFALTQKVTNDESVAYSFSGDRDNVKTLVTEDTEVTLAPLKVKVQALPKGTSLVGDFTLDTRFKTNHAEAYEPLPFELSIQGKGYPPLLENLVPKNDAYTLFEEKPIVQTLHSKQNTQSTVRYPMALSAAQSFSLAPIVINAFNPQSKKSYTLTVPGQDFVIKKEEVSILVDSIDSPKPFSRDWSWLSTLFSCLIVFGAGFLTAMVYKVHKKSLAQNKDPLIQKIDACKDEKALLQLLMANDSQKFVDIIETVENSLYKNSKIGKKKMTLKQCKEKAKEIL